MRRVKNVYYLHTRIKNTLNELASYDERMDRLIDRVFDEFGLIVCGWSAEWAQTNKIDLRGFSG